MGELTYKSAGVDKEAGYESVQKIKKFVKSTYTPYVMGDLGGFGGSVRLPEGLKKPILVSGTDGVGTKLLIAQQMDKHDTVGIDLVAMCVNDILCNGARPLYFLDYIACAKNEPDKIASIVKGVVEGCLQSECALVGGETAEMPGMYAEDDYDLAGFCSGVVEEENYITGKDIKEGDVLIGLASSGVHSNGFSLIRKLFFDIKNYDVNQYVDSLGMTLGEALITPTKIYVKEVLNLIDKVKLNGLCHITGGGFIENIPRMIGDGLCAYIDATNLSIPPIFELIMNEGEISKLEMYSTFNMGIGMVIAVSEENLQLALDTLKETNSDAIVLGKIIKGEEKIKLCL